MDAFLDLFRHFFWIIFPVLGMGIGALAIWTDHARVVKSLAILESYAAQGKDPPEALLNALPRPMSQPYPPGPQSRARHVANFALLIIMAAGFAGLAWFIMPYKAIWIFFIAFAIAAFCLFAAAIQKLVLALMTPRADGK